jgi:hypothetical protein
MTAARCPVKTASVALISRRHHDAFRVMFDRQNLTDLRLSPSSKWTGSARFLLCPAGEVRIQGTILAFTSVERVTLKVLLAYRISFSEIVRVFEINDVLVESLMRLSPIALNINMGSISVLITVWHPHGSRVRWSRPVATGPHPLTAPDPSSADPDETWSGCNRLGFHNHRRGCFGNDNFLARTGRRGCLLVDHPLTCHAASH